jgi:hypothetical protein
LIINFHNIRPTDGSLETTSELSFIGSEAQFGGKERSTLGFPDACQNVGAGQQINATIEVMEHTASNTSMRELSASASKTFHIGRGLTPTWMKTLMACNNSSFARTVRT